MKVYLVFVFRTWEDDQLVAAFSTRDKAGAWIAEALAEQRQEEIDSGIADTKEWVIREVTVR